MPLSAEVSDRNADTEGRSWRPSCRAGGRRHPPRAMINPQPAFCRFLGISVEEVRGAHGPK